MQRIWVQLCGKNRYKVTILIMHKGMRGKWDFIDMINGGVACLADEVQSRFLQRRVMPPVSVPPLLDKQQARLQSKYNAQSHGPRLKLDVYALMCEAIQFKCGICKFKLH